MKIIKFHGAVGHDFCDGDLDGLNAILRYELSSGITAACPTTMSFPPEVLFKAIDTALEAGSDRALIWSVSIWKDHLLAGKRLEHRMLRMCWKETVTCFAR